VSLWRVQIVSAFGRGESLALALREVGLQVRILDFTAAMPGEYARGIGPFPIIKQVFHPSQNGFLQEARELRQGLSLWLKDGPLELTGPFADFYTEHNSAVRSWRSGKSSGQEFGQRWLSRFLQEWTSPQLIESWESSASESFPAREALSLIPESRELAVSSFAMAQSRGIEVSMAQSFADSRTVNGRIQQVEADIGTRSVFGADHWIWCLSSSETQRLGPELAEKLFWRGVQAPEWTWLCFSGQMRPGPWTDGLPDYSVVIGDIYLPWVYANAFMLRRIDDTRFRVWLKVPASRARDIDARREWAFEVQTQLHGRLALADWQVDSADWNLCPHSEVYGADPIAPVNWKNWDWISPETLPRLDLSARLKREAEVLQRLASWHAEELKKPQQKEPADDRSLHAP
jgi:hypothetical protein